MFIFSKNKSSPKTVIINLLQRLPSKHGKASVMTFIGLEKNLSSICFNLEARIIEQGHRGTAQVDWTPGHSSIAGNKVADRLAKEAALESSKFSSKDLMIMAHMEQHELLSDRHHAFGIFKKIVTKVWLWRSKINILSNI